MVCDSKVFAPGNLCEWTSCVALILETSVYLIVAHVRIENFVNWNIIQAPILLSLFFVPSVRSRRKRSREKFNDVILYYLVAVSSDRAVGASSDHDSLFVSFRKFLTSIAQESIICNLSHGLTCAGYWYSISPEVHAKYDTYIWYSVLSFPGSGSRIPDIACLNLNTLYKEWKTDTRKRDLRHAPWARTLGKWNKA
jgi:hypothetical protein